MTHHRTWFPVILTGLSVLLAAAFFVAKVGQPARLPELPPSVTHEEYVTNVMHLAGLYAQDHNVQTAYDTLIMLRVPTEDQTLHLNLVIAMSKIVQGEAEEGEARLSALRVQYPWLPL